MPMKFDENPRGETTTDCLSEKAREAVRVLRQFRASKSVDPVFRSVRSRQLEIGIAQPPRA